MARKKGELGERHKKILDVIAYYQENVGYPPSIREIGKEAGISSTSVVNYYLNQLEEWNHIKRDRKISRGIRLIKSLKSAIDELVQIPLMGRIGAGIVIQSPTDSDFSLFTAEDSIDVARTLLPEREQNTQLFALQVQGDSMIDAMVNDGDIVIMKPAQVAENGEMVAVRLTDEDKTTLKFFYKENGHVRLQPANPDHQPQIISDPNSIIIQGKVVLVIRQIGGKLV